MSSYSTQTINIISRDSLYMTQVKAVLLLVIIFQLLPIIRLLPL